MFLIVGLGNPGKKFQKTRHNLGFIALNKLQKSNRFSGWKTKKKSQAEIAEGSLADKKVILAKPQTFMNESGQSVKSLIKNLKLETKNLVIIHDDIDLPLGKLKIHKNRGSAGHKGIQSVIDELRTKDFIRFRIGIQSAQGKSHSTDEFVLEKFSISEMEIIQKVIEKTIKEIKTLLDNRV